MRNTNLPSIDHADLAAVTGGCKKQAPPPQQPPPQQQAPQSYGGVDVTVATGAQAAQLIQGATQGAQV